MANAPQIASVKDEETCTGIKRECQNDFERQYQCTMCRHGFDLEDKLLEHSEEMHPFIDIKVKQELTCFGCDSQTSGCKSNDGNSNVQNNTLKVCVKTEEVNTKHEDFSEKLAVTESIVYNVEVVNLGEYHNVHNLIKKSYSCEMCTKTFSSASRLKRHVRSHTGEKPYACEICKKTFTENGVLKKHLRIHAGLKPFVCDVCQKSFSEAGALRTHRRIHTGEKPYSCDVCLKRFSENGNLTTHMRSHSGERPHLCDVCQKGFYTTGDLKKHMIIHTGERPFVCDVCQKKFSRRGNLNAHVSIHATVKPFSCDVCQKVFSRKDSLTHHLRRHDTEEINNS